MGGQRAADSPMLICNKPPEPRGYNPKRLQRLAQPKWTPTLDKLSFAGTFPTLEGEDQQLKWANVKYKEPSSRILELAKCKPMRPADISIMEIDQRMRTRRGGVSKAAKNATATERLIHLAVPKKESPLFLGGREVETVVTSAAKKAVCSSRTEELSKPKNHSNDHYFIENRKPEHPITKVTKSALKYQVSGRIQQLAKHNEFSKDFTPPNLKFWVVKRSALKTKCPERFEVLAKPIARNSMEEAQLKSNAFMVSEAAKKAKCSARLESLATPKRVK